MQKRHTKSSGRKSSQSGAASADDGSPAQDGPADDLTSLVDASLFVEERPSDHEQDSDLEDTAGLPNITRMPEGYEVVEQSVGRAVGQWVLQVRCECGRRWFEVEAIEATTCPRCGQLVYVDVQERGK